MPDLDEQLRDLATANRILAREGVVDAFGHASIRHPRDPDRYFLSCSRSPELVSRADLIEYRLDSSPVHETDRPGYVERPIHGAVYQARPDVNAVVHNHAHSVIPFGVTGIPLQQIVHVAGGIGATVPVWDIRDRFGDTNMLVTTQEQGLDMAAALGDGGAVLMRGHGCTTAATSLTKAVHLAIYLMVNAQLLLDSLRLGGTLIPMTAGEVRLTDEMTSLPVVPMRTWEYWKGRANLNGI